MELQRLKIKQHFWATLFEMELKQLLHVVEDFEFILEKERSDLERKFEETTAGWSDDDKCEYGEFLSEDWDRVSNVIPRLTQQSTFVMAFGLFEAKMRDLCELYARQPEYPSLTSSETSVFHYRAYLKSNVGLKFNRDFSKVLAVNCLRNVYVHYAGFVDNVAENLAIEVCSYIRRNPDLVALEEDRIHQVLVLDKIFLPRLLQSMINAIQTYK